MVTRWQLYDPVAVETYTFPRNPRSMTSIHPQRALTPGTTTAINGQQLVTEGNTPPSEWSFEGQVWTWDEYEALHAWTLKPYRIRVTDHFGRRFYVAFRGFNATPVRRHGKYWAHDYVIDAIIVTTPTAPTVGT